MRRAKAERRAAAGAFVALVLAGVSSNAGADRLGTARLFFGASERAAADAAAAEASGARESAASTVSEAARPPASVPPLSRPRFQARLRVGDGVGVIVGGRPCRASGPVVADRETRLHCRRLPAGVDALHLAVDGRLLATFDDGRRRAVALGAVLRR